MMEKLSTAIVVKDVSKLEIDVVMEIASIGGNDMPYWYRNFYSQKSYQSKRHN